MKTLIIYGSPTKLSNQHQAVKTDDGQYFIRLEISKKDALHALGDAEPVKGETVLNAVEV